MKKQKKTHKKTPKKTQKNPQSKQQQKTKNKKTPITIKQSTRINNKSLSMKNC